MKFLIAVISCLAFAHASSIWGHGHHDHHIAVVGASGIVTGHGASGPSGIVNGHGAIGPSGEHNANHHIYGHGHPAWGHQHHVAAPHVIVGHHGIAHGHVAAPQVIIGHHGHAAPAIFAHGPNHHGWAGHPW